MDDDLTGRRLGRITRRRQRPAAVLAGYCVELIVPTEGRRKMFARRGLEQGGRCGKRSCFRTCLLSTAVDLLRVGLA